MYTINPNMLNTFQVINYLEEIKIQIAITGINYILKYIKIEKLFKIIIIFHIFQ